MAALFPEISLSCLLVVTNNDNDVFLKSALDSVGTKQTRPANEYIIVRNGPLNTKIQNVLLTYSQSHNLNVTFVDLPQLTNLSRALNAGLDICTSDFIVRMDPDDISTPQRFESQLSFLLAQQDYHICGTWIGEFENDMSNFRLRKLPTSHEAIVKFAKFRNPIAHPSVMYRAYAIKQIGGYPDILKAQDYLLWVTAIMAGLKFANLPTLHLYFRSDSNHLRRRGWHYFQNEVVILMKMKHIGFLTFRQFFVSFCARLIVRTQGIWLRKIIYKLRK